VIASASLSLSLREIVFGVYILCSLRKMKWEEERFYFSMGFPTVLPHSAHEPS
jgi:hypothetical protein